jgi:hypothetical protein
MVRSFSICRRSDSLMNWERVALIISEKSPPRMTHIVTIVVVYFERVVNFQVPRCVFRENGEAIEKLFEIQISISIL